MTFQSHSVKQSVLFLFCLRLAFLIHNMPTLNKVFKNNLPRSMTTLSEHKEKGKIQNAWLSNQDTLNSFHFPTNSRRPNLYFVFSAAFSGNCVSQFPKYGYFCLWMVSFYKELAPSLTHLGKFLTKSAVKWVNGIKE